MATRRKTSSKNNTAKSSGFVMSKQLKSVILFAIAILLASMVFIKGQNLWTIMHNFIFSILGVTAYFIPFILNNNLYIQG